MKLFFLFFLFAKGPADEVLQKTSDKLNSVKAIRYDHERDYFTGDKHYISRATNYFDFNSDDKLIGLRYWSETPDYTAIYNGTENFSLDKKEQTIQINNNPTVSTLEGNSFYYNSLLTLRRNLPTIIADKSVSKTIKDTQYANAEAYLVRFTLYKKSMENFGGFMPIGEDRYFHYSLIINRSTLLPLSLTQSNSADEHTATVTYKNVETDPKAPKEEDWYYSSYTTSYKMADKKDDIIPLAAGLAAPDFEVESFSDGSKLNLSKYKGKTVLLEFWIRNCGPCIESVPKINELKEKFKDLEILAINSHDRKETVDYFVKRYKVKYPIAFKGEEAAKQYGVAAFPVAFIINKKGNIVYSGGYDDDAIKKVLKELL